MREWLGPDEIQLSFKVGRTTAYKLLNEFEKERPDMVAVTGKKQRRVPEDLFTEFVLKRKAE